MAHIFEILEELSSNACFLCGADLTADSDSAEHVLPKWVQQRFNLYEEKLTLLNSTAIPYRTLTIPCCKTCNNEHLSKLESRVQAKLFSPTFRTDATLTSDLAIWLAKIFFGILYKETRLRLDRKTPESEPIVPLETIRNLKILHAFLQSLRYPMTVESAWGNFPASVFVFEVMESAIPRQRFDFRDSLPYQSLFIHLGSRAVVVCFDGGTQARKVAGLYESLVSRKLHPIQVREFAANVFYAASLFQRVPLYQTVETPDHTWIAMLALDGHEKRGSVQVVDFGDGRFGSMANIPNEVLETPEYRDWVQYDYAHMLSWFTGVPVGELNPKKDMVVTYIWNEDTTFKELPEETA